MDTYKSPAIHRTPIYRAKSAYVGMMARCLNKNGKNPSYTTVELKMTQEEWLKWALPKYEKFIEEHPCVSPCAARFGDAGHYEIGNVRIISVEQNRSEMKTEMQLRPDGTKRCSRCRKLLEASENFSKNKFRSDGYATDCKICHREYCKRR